MPSVPKVREQLHGQKRRLGWRPGGGSRNFVYLSFGLDDPQYDKAKSLIESQDGDITKEGVVAALSNTSVEHVVALKREHAAANPSRLKVPTVAELVNPYLEYLRTKEEPTQEDTLDSYRYMLTQLWVSRIGGQSVNQVSSDDIENAMKLLQVCDCSRTDWGKWCGSRRGRKSQLKLGDPHEPGLAKKTRDRYFSVIRGLFNFAVKKGYLEQSPVKEARYRPQSLSRYNELKKEEKHFYLTKPQFALVRSKMRPEMQTMLNTIGETGFRFSEVTSLQVKKFVAGPKPKILVTESFKKLKRRPGDGLQKGQRNTGLPKSKKTDVLAISLTLAAQLERLITEKELGPDDYIFTTPQGNLINHSNFLRDEWEPAIRAAQRCPDHPPAEQVSYSWDQKDLLGPRCGDNGGLNARRRPCSAKVMPGTNRCYAHVGVARDAISTCECTDPENPKRLDRRLTPHDIRHTYIAWRIEAGDPVMVLADRTRHAPEVLAAVYAGILDGTREKLADSSAIDF